MISRTRLPLFSRAYVEKIGEPGDEATITKSIIGGLYLGSIGICTASFASCKKNGGALPTLFEK